MKAFTDIEQSKKLVEILPIESADMYYCGSVTPDVMTSCKQDYRCYTPCWSLVALLDVLPISINEGQHCLALINSDPNGIDWLCCYENYKGESMMECYADNQVDACVEMIYKLKEKDLL